MHIKVVRKKFILFFAGSFFYLIFIATVCHSQQEKLAADRVYDSLFQTILFYRTGWDLSMPILVRNEEEGLTLRFDYLGNPRHDLIYTIRNCSFDWKINDVSEHRYLEGFNEIPLYDYSMSRNTLADYAHYHTMVPDENQKLLHSGNYLLSVSSTDDRETPLLEKRFCINEKQVEIRAEVKRINDTEQELQIQVNLERLRVTNPLSEIKVRIVKNYNWNDQLISKSPPVLRDQVLYLDMPYQLVAEAGTEFRNFDIKSIKYISEHIDHIEYKVPYYHFYLKPDEANPYVPYFSSSDLNGRYYIESSDANDRFTEADYVYVHFFLKSPQPVPADVYIYGALTGWKTGESNYMYYDHTQQAYVKTLRLKQGFYDYCYVTREYDSEAIRMDMTEGNYSETENDYLIFVYYRETMNDFDRLVGYSLVNSTGKVQ
jgi:hypothetical protein